MVKARGTRESNIETIEAARRLVKLLEEMEDLGGTRGSSLRMSFHADVSSWGKPTARRLRPREHWWSTS